MGELINGRCPAEIKSGLRNMLETCADISGTKDTICQEMCCPYDDDNCCHETILMGALALIERLESEHEEFERLESERDEALAKVPKWISVKERLPVKKYRVIVRTGHNLVTTGWRSYHVDVKGGELWEVDEAHNYRNDVTHWMPLPQPPEEE